MIEWNDIATLPNVDGEYLCYVRIPKREHGRDRSTPEHFRYMTLEFAEGVFWINNGAPDGFVLFWTNLNPPQGRVPPTLRQRKVSGVHRGGVDRILEMVNTPTKRPKGPEELAMERILESQRKRRGPLQLEVTAEEDEAFEAMTKHEPR